MTPSAIADALAEEFQDELADRGLPAARWGVLDVTAPPDLSPDGWFELHLRLDGQPVTWRLPAGTAAAYFADEEAAVDEWKRWTTERLGPW